MQKYITWFFSGLLFLTACSDNDVPKGILDKPHMISLLTDIHLTDGQLYNVSQDRDSLYKYGIAKYNRLFKAHNTTDAIFKKSFEYYTNRPELIEEVYTQVAANLQAKTDSLNKAGKKQYQKNALPQ